MIRFIGILFVWAMILIVGMVVLSIGIILSPVLILLAICSENFRDQVKELLITIKYG